MCDPISIGMGVLGGVGSLINAQESAANQSAMIQARNAATMRELERNRAYQAESAAKFSDTLSKFAPDSQAQALTDTQTKATADLNANAPDAAAVGSISTTSAPRVVSTAEDKRLGDVFARAGDSNARLGKLAGWDQRGFQNNLTLNQSGRDIDMVGDFAKTSAAVSGAEQAAAAQNAQRAPSGIGDILKFAGQIGSYGSGRGWFNTPTVATPGAPLDIRPLGLYR